MHHNDISDYLLADRSWGVARAGLEKIAIDQHLRNITAEIARAGGDALSVYNHSPMVASALTGAAAGGAINAMRGDEDESKLRRFGRGAVGGAVVGLGTYLAAPGAVRMLGRKGEAVSHAMEGLRGAQRSPGRNVAVGEFGPALTKSLSRDAAYARIHTDLPGIAQERDRVIEQLRKLPDGEGRKAAVEQLESLNERFRELAERGTGAGALGGAGLLAAAGGAGGAVSDRYIDEHMNKESSARLARIVPGIGKRANFLASGLGHLASGAGKAVTTIASNPGAMGAVGGAVIGAGMAGEGNRIGGALAGATLGGGLGYAAGKGLLGAGATNAASGLTTATNQFGQKLTQAGVGVVGAAATPATQGAAAQTFGQMVSTPFKTAFSASV